MKQTFCTLFLVIICTMRLFAQGEWVWANRSFKGGHNEGVSTSTDKDGNVFVGGIMVEEMITGHIDLNPGYNNDRDIFVVKYDSMGNALWGKRFGGHHRDVINAISTDSDGGVFISGYFLSDTIRFDNIVLTNPSLNVLDNFFIAKLDLNGNVVWAKKAIGDIYIGNKGDIASDLNGNVYVTGTFGRNSLVFDGITIQYDSTVSSDGCYYDYSSFIAKYNSGGDVVWAKKLMGSSPAPSIAINSKGEIYLMGTALCKGRDIGKIELHNPGAFLAKLDADGNVLWVKDFADDPQSGLLGFPLNSNSSGISIDSLDNVYIVGAFLDSLFVDHITLYSSISPGTDWSIFAAKFDDTDHALWAKVVTRGDANGIAVNKAGNLFITGRFDFNIVTTPDTLIHFGNINLTESKKHNDPYNAFVVQFDQNGTELWANLIDYNSLSNDIAVFSHHVYITGTLWFSPYELNNRPINFGDIEIPPQLFNQNIFFEGPEMFIAKLKPCHEIVNSFQSTASLCPGDSVTLASNSSSKGIWSTGETSQSITVKAPGVYTYPLFNSNGCLTSTQITNVTLLGVSEAAISYTSPTICEGTSEELVSTEATSYLWNTGATSQSLSASESGIYNVTIRDANGCRATSSDVELKYIEPLPEILLFSDCNKIFAKSDYPLAWYKNNELLTPEDLNQKEIYPSDSGLYFSEVSNLCETKRSNTINFKPATLNYIFQPNVITPNDDLYNEYFILDKKLSNSSLMVVNRWGKEVFYSQNYENNWNGDDLFPGVYYYIIKNACFTEKIKGTLTIQR